ncbi:MAG: tagaturonate epimerase family protein [Anaerolineae bacterium]
MMQVFESSRIVVQSIALCTARSSEGDQILASHPGASAPPDLGLVGGRTQGQDTIYPANYDNMLVWERRLAPARRLLALNSAGYPSGFGAGNRLVVATGDCAHLADLTTMAGWDGIHAASQRSAVPFWYIQQSIVRELIPEGVDPKDYPGIGHTGGYGPREFLRAGLFAFASRGGYAAGGRPIGADADHAIVVGHDEESLHASLAFNKLAMAESRDYTKFTVDNSHLFGFPVALSAAEERRVRQAFGGRSFTIANILPNQPSLHFSYVQDEALRLARKYWQACSVHRELYEHALAIRAGQPFDYELSLDETPDITPPRDLLFYLVLLHDVMGLPPRAVASAGPNIGFIKRHDYEGDLQRDLWPQVNACASILQNFGAMLSVHSADGVRAATGKGAGVDAVLASATGGRAELKVADVYQEVLWQVLADSPVPAEREVFVEAWRRTCEAARHLQALYESELAPLDTVQARRLLASDAGRERLTARYGTEALHLAQGVIGYGLPVFRLAADLLPRTDPRHPAADSQLFRRFMFLVFRGLRPALFQAMTKDGWQRLSAAIEEATMIRLNGMGWTSTAPR